MPEKVESSKPDDGSSTSDAEQSVSQEPPTQEPSEQLQQDVVEENDKNTQVQESQNMTASCQSVQSNKSTKSRKKGSQSSMSSGSSSSCSNRNRITNNIPTFLKDRLRVTFVYPLEPKHECPSCDEVLRYPIRFEECEHRVCAHCFETKIKRNDHKKCPVDHNPVDVDAATPDEELNKEIISLEVKCLTGEWCKWEGEFQQILEHMDICEYAEVLCVNDCGETLQRREMQKHLDKTCPKKIISCPYCDDRHLREDKKEHMQECLKMPLPCPNKCDKSITITREELDRHIEEQCPKTKVACEFEEVGCEHKCGREKLPKHYKGEIISHVNLVYRLAMENKDRLDKHENVMAHHMKLIEDANKRIGFLERIAHNAIIWRLDDYHRKKTQAKSNTKLDTLFSPSFHTSRHGYRLCASVCLNGDGKGKGKYISVFVCILKGAYDGLLRWPFEHEINITLLDQDDNRHDRHHTQCCLKPNACPENMPFLGQPKFEKNASFGSSMFVSHEDIETKKFLKDETLFFKIVIGCDEESEP